MNSPAHQPCGAYIIVRCPNESLPPDYKRCSEHPVSSDVKRPICSCAMHIAKWIRSQTWMQPEEREAAAQAIERGDWRS